MKAQRIKHFSEMTLEELKELTYKDFLVSEIEELIADTPLRDEEKRMCVSFFIKKKTNQEVADEFCFSLDTAKRNRKELSIEMKETLVKNFFCY